MLVGLHATTLPFKSVGHRDENFLSPHPTSHSLCGNLQSRLSCSTHGSTDLGGSQRSVVSQSNVRGQVNRAQTETNGLHYCALVFVLTPVTTFNPHSAHSRRAGGSRFKIINGSIT